MIKVGNVWYPESQRKEAVEAFKMLRKAWITERRKRSLYGTYKRNNSSYRSRQRSR